MAAAGVVTKGPGESWTFISNPTNRAYAMTYGNGMYVIICDTNGLFLYSSDLINWTTLTRSNYSWANVNFLNGYFIAVIDQGAGVAVAAISTDGINWSDIAVPNEGGFYCVAYGNGTYVATSYNNYVAVSSNIVTWNAVPVPSGYWSTIVFGNGVFVAIGYQLSTVITSSDGNNWSTNSIWATAQGTNNIIFANNKFVIACGTSVSVSSDGYNWSVYSLPSASTTWYSPAYGKGTFIIVGGVNIVTSTDAVHWTLSSSSLPFSVGRNLFYANQQFISGPKTIMTSP
jgi:hypothetical protein